MTNIEVLDLVPPTAELRAEFLAVKAEYKTVNDRHLAIHDLYHPGLAETDFVQYVQNKVESSHGLNLKPGRVPSSTFWLVRNADEILGVSHLRHRLTPALEHEGGHIGYNIRPSARQKGYGTVILSMTLGKAKARGIRRVLLTCAADNIASIRVIEKNGGHFSDERISDDTGRRFLRYWIML